jgi:hypothetical protein
VDGKEDERTRRKEGVEQRGRRKGRKKRRRGRRRDSP